jgi:hypothetical protein
MIMDRFKLSISSVGVLNNKDYSKIKKAITSGFFVNACRRESDGFKTVVDN